MALVLEVWLSPSRLGWARGLSLAVSLWPSPALQRALSSGHSACPRTWAQSFLPWHFPKATAPQIHCCALPTARSPQSQPSSHQSGTTTVSREAKQLTPGHTAGIWWSRDWRSCTPGRRAHGKLLVEKRIVDSLGH